MPKEQGEKRRVRLFVALDLPDRLRAEIEAWGRGQLTDPALRPTAPESLHITLAFLGHRSEREVEQLGELVREQRAVAPIIRLDDPVARPSKRQARLFALPAISAGTIALQAELEAALVEQRLYEPEARLFWPHVTVARVKSADRGRRRPGTVAKPPGKLPAGLLEPFLGVRMTLYRSELQPLGAKYIPLAQVELSEDGRQ